MLYKLFIKDLFCSFPNCQRANAGISLFGNNVMNNAEKKMEKSLILVIVLKYYDEKFPYMTVLHLIEEETSLYAVLINC